MAANRQTDIQPLHVSFSKTVYLFNSQPWSEMRKYNKSQGLSKEQSQRVEGGGGHKED